MNPPNKQEWEQFFSKAIPTSATSAPSQQQQAPPQQSTLPTSTPGGIKPPTQQMTPQQQQQLLAMLQNINANQVARTANPVLSANTAVPIAAPVVVPQPQTVQPPSAPLAQSNLDVKQMLMNTLSQAVASQQQQQQASNLTAALAQQLLNQGNTHYFLLPFSPLANCAHDATMIGLNNNQNNNLFGNALNVAQLLQQQQQQQAQQPQQRLNQNDLLTALLTKSLLEANQAQQQQQQQQSVAYEPTSSQQSGQASRGNFDRNDVRYQTSSTSTSSVANTQHTNQPQHSNHHNNANNTAQRNNHSFSSPSSNNRAAAHNNFRKSRWSMSAQDPLALGAFVGIPSSNPDPPTFVPKGYIPNHLQASSFSTSASNMNSMPTSGGGPLRFSQANAGTNQVGASAAAGGRGGGFISHNTKALATNNTIVVRKRGRSSSPSPRRSRSRSPSNRNNFPNTGVNMNRSNTGAAMGSAGASSSLSSHTMPNKASSSSMNTSASTVISTAAGNRAAVSVRGNVPIAATTSANSTTAAAAAAAASSKPSPSTATTLSSLTLKDLSTKYNLPIITPSTQSLNTMDLNMRYPNLYIPTDFIEVVIDWQEVLSKLLHEDYFVDLLTPCHPVIESNPSIMITETLPIALPQSIGEDNKGVGETREEQNVENVDNNFEVFLQQKAFQTSLQPDSLLPPKYTYLYDNVINHTLTSDPLCSLANHNRSSQAIYTMKEQQPIRFNVRILLSYGLSSEEESITERQAFRKLRVLLGRRKSMQTLLGAVYHSQLDGGNPLLDRNCLEETAKRALFAQCGIPHLPHTDASSASSNKAIPSAFCRLGELHYHRPREEIASKIYPEQEEISVLYLYRLDTKLLQQEVEEYVEHYLEQQEENQGEDHAHDHTEEEESFELKKKECLQGIEEKLWQVFQRRVLGSHPGPLLSHTYQEEIFPSLEANFDNAHEMEEKMEETKQKTMFNRELQRFNDKIGDLLQSQEREKQMKLQKLVAAGVMKAEELQLPTTVIATNAVTPSASSEDSPIVEEAIAEASPTVDSNNNTTDDAVVNMEESKATDEKIPSSEEEAVVVSHVPTEAYNIHGELLKASILQRHHKPTSLNYLIAPMPLPFEYHTNKKSDSFALRSTVLSSLLSYSLVSCYHALISFNSPNLQYFYVCLG